MRPPRRLPLSWGKGRSRAAAQRRIRRARFICAAFRCQVAVPWPGNLCPPHYAARTSYGDERADRITEGNVARSHAEDFNRIRYSGTSFAAYCEMAR
jgi:hypothetical protein